jgi:ring-1,2-phenylacetyl-CoA epoxidase subunit PaaC
MSQTGFGPCSLAKPGKTAQYTLRLADDALVLSQQLGLWITRAPQIEEELALANIALDLLGQARQLLSAVGDEDELAFLRIGPEFRNLLLVEQPNGDFAQTMIRQLLFSTFQLARYRALLDHPDETLSGVAARGAKEATYHCSHATAWVLRLGDGTSESRRRAVDALNRLWPFTDEMFHGDETDRQAGINPAELRAGWLDVVSGVLAQATLTIPVTAGPGPGGGRRGEHTPHLGRLLADMQSLHLAHPGASW